MLSSFQGSWRCGLSLFSPLRGSLWSVDLWETWDCRQSMRWSVCCLCGPSPSSGPSLQCWDGTDTLWARLEPPVSLTGEQPSFLLTCTESLTVETVITGIDCNRNLLLAPRAALWVLTACSRHSAEICMDNWLMWKSGKGWPAMDGFGERMAKAVRK